MIFITILILITTVYGLPEQRSMAVNPHQLAAAVQAALSGISGADAGSQLVAALASTIEQQVVQSASLHEQLQQLEQKMMTPTRDASSTVLINTKTLGRVSKFRGMRNDWPD